MYTRTLLSSEIPHQFSSKQTQTSDRSDFILLKHVRDRFAITATNIHMHAYASRYSTPQHFVCTCPGCVRRHTIFFGAHALVSLMYAFCASAALGCVLSLLRQRLCRSRIARTHSPHFSLWPAVDRCVSFRSLVVRVRECLCTIYIHRPSVSLPSSRNALLRAHSRAPGINRKRNKTTHHHTRRTNNSVLKVHALCRLV